MSIEKYDYRKALYDDIDEYVKDNKIDLNNIDRDNFIDELWNDNDITGNQYGYDNQDAIEGYLAYNLPLAIEAIDDFFVWESVGDHWRATINSRLAYIDTTIRCYLLPQIVDQYLEDHNKESKND